MYDTKLLENERDHLNALEEIITSPVYLHYWLNDPRLRNLSEVIGSLIILKCPIDKE